MRTIAVAALLALLPFTGFAQDGPPPTTKPVAEAKPSTFRVSLKGVSKTDGEPDEPNKLQGFVLTQLHQFGVRVDSLVKVGDEGMDKWIKGQTKRWAKREPEAPPASLAIECTQTVAYNGAKFYGETQAHVFKGRVSATICNAEGVTLAEIDYGFEWGKAVRRKQADGSIEQRTKPAVKNQFDQLVQKTLVVGLLSQESIRDGLPKGKLKKVDAYIAKTIDYIKGVLEKSTKSIRQGEMMQFLDSIESDD